MQDLRGTMVVLVSTGLAIGVGLIIAALLVGIARLLGRLDPPKPTDPKD